MAKQVLMTYSVLDGVYQNPSLRYLRGLQDALSTTPNIGTIDDPRDTNVPLLSTDPDPKMFSFVGSDDGVRVLLSKVVTPVSGSAPFTTWTLLGASTSGTWTTLAKDIVLATPGLKNQAVATNSYGVAQVGDWLYIVDYDSQNIYTLGVNELNGLPDGTVHTLLRAPLDLGPGTTANLLATTMGQAIIALSDKSDEDNPVPYLFALYTESPTPYTVQNPGYLVRITVDAATGALTYDTQCTTGRNPQEIVPLTMGDGTVVITIPCVGGPQQAGGSNGQLSRIVTVLAFDSPWPATADTLVIGTSSTWDFFNIAAPNRADNSGIVYILTYDYNADYTTTDWALYSTTVSTLLGLPAGSTIAALGSSIDSDTAAPGYFWNILFENGDSAQNDRLWFFRGTPLLATPALDYAAPPQTGVTNRFFDFGDAANQIGGENVDWADLTIETVRQAAAGVSLKRSVQAQKAPAPKAEGEEEK
jgi:hypothetical protein